MTEPDFCLECLEEFHYDDTGGYNPPCACKECDGFYCRSCCRAELELSDHYERPDETYPEDSPTP